MSTLHLQPGVPTLAMRDNCVSLVNLQWTQLCLEGPEGVPPNLEVVYGFFPNDVRRALCTCVFQAGGWRFGNLLPVPISPQHAAVWGDVVPSLPPVLEA